MNLFRRPWEQCLPVVLWWPPQWNSQLWLGLGPLLVPGLEAHRRAAAVVRKFAEAEPSVAAETLAKDGTLSACKPELFAAAVGGTLAPLVPQQIPPLRRSKRTPQSSRKTEKFVWFMMQPYIYLHYSSVDDKRQLITNEPRRRVYIAPLQQCYVLWLEGRLP